MDELEEYINRDIFNPKYLFHGSSFILKTIEPRQSFDSKNKTSKDNAIFLTSWFINSVEYAFSRKLKELNENYTLNRNNIGKLLAMEFEGDVLPVNLYEFVYINEIKNFS